MIKYRSLRAT